MPVTGCAKAGANKRDLAGKASSSLPFVYACDSVCAFVRLWVHLCCAGALFCVCVSVLTFLPAAYASCMLICARRIEFGAGHDGTTRTMMALACILTIVYY